MTPPSSASIVVPEVGIPPQEIEAKKDSSGTQSPENSHKDSSKKCDGSKKIRRDRSKLYKEKLKLQVENVKLKKKYEKYKKQCQIIKLKNCEKYKTDEKNNYKELSSAIKEKYRKKEKNILKDIFEGIDKSLKNKMIEESLGLTGLIRISAKVYKPVTKLKKRIEQFFLRDDVSRATAGKKETITKQGEKIQKRYLLDTMRNLYNTFILEYPDKKC